MPAFSICSKTTYVIFLCTLLFCYRPHNAFGVLGLVGFATQTFYFFFYLWIFLCFSYFILNCISWSVLINKNTPNFSNVVEQWHSKPTKYSCNWQANVQITFWLMANNLNSLQTKSTFSAYVNIYCLSFNLNSV